LVHDLDVEALFGLLDHDVLGRLGEFRHVLEGLAERGRGKREGAVLLEPRAGRLLAIVLVALRRRRRLLGRNVLGLFELRPGRQARHLDDARITHGGLHAEGVAHRAGHDLELVPDPGSRTRPTSRRSSSTGP
jgi:hypothetical protein